MSKIEDIVTKFTRTGYCEIDFNLLIKKWNKLFRIVQWDDSYRLVKYKRHNSPNTNIKCKIRPEVAEKIINTLDLKCYNEVFESATTWKK